MHDTVSPACLEVPPLGPKWDRWAKKIRCASDPPIPADSRLEDWMRTRVFSPTYPTWALVGGDFKASRRNCIYIDLNRCQNCSTQFQAGEMARVDYETLLVNYERYRGDR